MPQNRSIHGLRGLAILLVFVLHAHLAMVTGAFPSAPAEGSLAAMVLGYGHRGVELFFMISGYLIVASLVRHNKISRFVTQRAIRIYPAFLGPHLLVFLAGPWVGYARMSDLDAPQWTIHFVSNLLMLPGLFDLFIANPVAWTLSLEMAFYLLAAWAYAIVVCRNRAAKMAMGLAWMAAAGTVLAWHPRAWFFAAGALVWFLQPWLERSPLSARLPRWTAALALALLCILFDTHPAIALACGLVGFAGVVSQRDVFCRLLHTRPMQYLGEISYSLYLWHLIVLFPLKRIFGYGHGPLVYEPANSLAFLALAVAGSLLVAHVSYRAIEQGLTRCWFPRPAAPATRAIAPPHRRFSSRRSAASLGVEG